jgi:hypothetical protein
MPLNQLGLGRCGTSALVLWVVVLATTVTVIAQSPNRPSGGWVEQQGSATRARYSVSQLQAFVPSTRGPFTFPAPYNTQAMRITEPSDCGGQDCVNTLGYSYWRNTNAHAGSDTMWIFIGLSTAKGGNGPTLFQYHKQAHTLTKIGPLFDRGSKFHSSSGQGWYFSATQPNTLYINDDTKLLRYDVVSKRFETVFDSAAQFGEGYDIWQMHSSDDDRVHSATLRNSRTKEYLGCFVYQEATRQFSYYPKEGVFDECHLDKSGQYLALFEQIDSNPMMDNVFVDLHNGEKKTMYNAMGHHDMGYGYIIGGDGWNKLPNALVVYRFLPTFVSKEPVVFYNVNWKVSAANHISHSNAQAGVPMNRQFACGSNADRTAIQNEIVCFRLDGSREQLVVAPVMTNMEAAGGGIDYVKFPKGNLDITGQYFIWTSNLSGNRLDAFLVRVPSQLLLE